MGGDASCQNFVLPTVHGDEVEDVTVTIKVVSWNIAKREQPWHELVQMAREGDADVALLQEAGGPPGELVDTVAYSDAVFWNRQLYDRWPLVVQLSDRVTIEPYRQVPPISELGHDAIGVSGIGTLAAARVVPRGHEADAFVAVSMYARWMKLIRQPIVLGVLVAPICRHTGSSRTCRSSLGTPTLGNTGSWLRVI